jgi:hypothetical protein
LLNQRFLQALLLDFDAHGREAIEECRKQSPRGYVKVLGHLVPREMKVQHSQSFKSMSDEELDAAIEHLRGMLATRAGDGAKEPSHCRRQPSLSNHNASARTGCWSTPTARSARGSAGQNITSPR